MAGMEIVRFRYLPERWEALAYGGGILANLRHQPLNVLAVPFFVRALMRTARELIREIDFSAVHAHWLLPQGWAAVRLGIPGMRVVCTAHGSDLHALGGPVHDHLTRGVLTRAGAVTVVSHFLAQRALALGASPDRLSVIPMGVDTQRFAATPDPGNETLLCIGRLAAEKGFDLALRAFSRLTRTRPGARLIFVGDGPLRDSLQRLAQRLGVDGRVCFLGARPQEELPRLLAEASVVVVPSRREGFGLAAAEALACGRAVVASDLPALREVIEHERTGLLVRPDDDQALAQALTRLLADPILRSHLGSAGRARAVAEWDWTTVASRYARLLHPERSHG